MSNLQHRQSKIQVKRKKTPWREFVMEIASWVPLNFYKNQKQISRYPVSERIGSLTSSQDFFKSMDSQKTIEVWLNSFFQTYIELFKHIDLPSLLEAETENANYADNVRYAKNVYLSFAVVLDCDNVLYSVHIKEKCENVFNSLMIWDWSKNVYQSKSILKSYNILYSEYIYNSNNIRFSSNLIWCSECILCNELINKNYCIKNIQLSKEEYFNQKIEILNQKDSFSIFLKKKIWKPINSEWISNSWFVVNSSQITNSYNVYNVKNGNNLYDVWSTWWNENIYDSIIAWSPHGNNFYASLYSWPWEHIYCSEAVAWWQNNYYSYFLLDCSFCFGCIGLKNKSYCILNKQYTKEERYEKVDEIFSQMDADGTLGEFFPATMNPFYFNDTAAYLIDPSFTKEEVTAKWYLWRDEPIKVDIPAWVQTVKISELDQYEGYRDNQRHIDPEIMKKVIIDEQWNAYRIIPMEYEFLMKHGLPLPRKHWLDRMKENFRIN